MKSDRNRRQISRTIFNFILKQSKLTLFPRDHPKTITMNKSQSGNIRGDKSQLTGLNLLNIY